MAFSFSGFKYKGIDVSAPTEQTRPVTTPPADTWASLLRPRDDGTKSIKKAAKFEKELSKEEFEFAKRLYEEQQPFRQAALEAIPLIQQELKRDYRSPTFQRDLESSMRSLQGQLAAYGLQDSSVAARASADLVGRLKESEMNIGENRRLNLINMLLGKSESGYGATLGSRSIGAQLGESYAQTLSGIGTLDISRDIAKRQSRNELIGSVLGAGTTAAFLL